MLMIKKIEDGIYRVHKRDMRTHKTAIIEWLAAELQGGFSYLCVTTRNDSKINGSWERVKDIENDYRSHCLIIVK